MSVIYSKFFSKSDISKFTPPLIHLQYLAFTQSSSILLLQTITCKWIVKDSL